MTPAPVTENRSIGIGLLITAMFTMTAMDAAVKWAVADYSLQQVNFIRSIAAIAVLTPLLWKNGGLRALHTTRPWVHVWRASLMLIISYTWFYALGRMKLADIGAIVMVSPLMITALSAPLLGEKVGLRRWIAVGIGFAGMLTIVRPGAGVFQPVALLAVTVAFGYALLILSNRANRAKESLAALTYYPLIGIFIVSGALTPLDWTQPTAGAWTAMVFIGVCAGIGHVCLTLAFRYASPPVLAPLEYTGLIWAILFGYWFFDELPDQWTVVGMVMIASAGVFVVYREASVSDAPVPDTPAANADLPS
ncbi:MAG: DMT family transporter [Rhodospirillaceae bacterium]|jgi:drug/metabolite transporter (DMT)-like permease|nr:DMT family transporter [Rhodospirillaceae bacterium]MBT5565894.1 DMT family transporter [Rhodospirillaceae bacterium]MBT6088686.1 DMT family transporter [Rhodospirillaceae bacterium]MBT7450124.1 DMT family transporter [Rhodospirillaceae bacterium]